MVWATFVLVDRPKDQRQHPEAQIGWRVLGLRLRPRRPGGGWPMSGVRCVGQDVNLIIWVERVVLSARSGTSSLVAVLIYAPIAAAFLLLSGHTAAQSRSSADSGMGPCRRKQLWMLLLITVEGLERSLWVLGSRSCGGPRDRREPRIGCLARSCSTHPRHGHRLARRS